MTSAEYPDLVSFGADYIHLILHQSGNHEWFLHCLHFTYLTSFKSLSLKYFYEMTVY